MSVDAMIGTSRTFACARQLHSVFSAATWTLHPTTGESPLVGFAGINTDAAYETVVIVGTNESVMSWVAFNPPVLDEEFDIFVDVSTEVPGSENTTDTTRTFGRLEELCGIVQTELRDMTTGQPKGGFYAGDGNGCFGLWWEVGRNSWQLEPTAEGWIGSARLAVHFHTRF